MVGSAVVIATNGELQQKIRKEKKKQSEGRARGRHALCCGLRVEAREASDGDGGSSTVVARGLRTTCGWYTGDMTHGGGEQRHTVALGFVYV
ncbi:hypothetical protein A2U01_0062855 [Trifolium medium]|uniref:Uncharacterized protein n=1 Tax=Trifolium medium TaxID=97028 RepID=A0A392RZQ8_9FABA|nr:hypothetical protein [Trifolium medium]